LYNTKKLLITGHSGMLGSDLVGYFSAFKDYEIFGLGRSKTDLLPLNRQFIHNLEYFKSEDLNGYSFDLIIHTAALTDINLCESNRILADKLNINASFEIAKLAKVSQSKLFYISTDSVFDGEKGNYSELEIPVPLNYYAQTKYLGENKVLETYEENSTIIRTNIYGVNEPFKNTIVEWAINEWSKNNPIRGFTDVIFNALYTSQLSDILQQLIVLNINEKILNIGSSEFISKYDFLNKLRIKLGYEEKLLIHSNSSEFVSQIKRPTNTTLNVSNLKNLINVPSFDDGIEKLVNKLKKT
jgi:dTDP-4-dehydrorhamnose reductase